MNINWEEFGFRKDYDEKNRIVKQEYVTYENNEYFVSTVDLGLNHQFGEGEPLYYETMIFLKDNYCDLYCDRYATREEALKGHNVIIEAFKNKTIKIENGYFELKEDKQ